MKSKISLIVPVFNESEEIDNFFNELKICNSNLVNEIIFVDDCSTDDSFNLLKKKLMNLKFYCQILIFYSSTTLKTGDMVFL